MAVIWIINQYGGIPRVGIAGRHYQFAKRLSENGHKVYLICGSSHHHQNKEERRRRKKTEVVAENFSVVWLKTLQYNNSNSPLRFANWFVFALKLFFLGTRKIEAPDIVYYSSLSLVGTLSAEFQSKRFGVPYIFEERDIWPLTLKEIKSVSRHNPFVVFLQMLQDRAYKRADLVVSPIPGVVEHIKQRKIGAQDFLWLPNGCNQPPSKELSDYEHKVLEEIKSCDFSLGYVGSFGNANRLGVLLEAAARLKDISSVEIILIGSGALHEEHKKFVIENGLTNVKIFDKISRSAVFECYKLFDVCYIGWGNYKMYDFGTSANKVSEYMSAGRPILQSYSGQFDIVESSGSGITVDADCPKSVSDGIQKFASMDKAKLEEMGLNALKCADEDFRYDSISKRLMEKILSLLEQKPKRRGERQRSSDIR